MASRWQLSDADKKDIIDRCMGIVRAESSKPRDINAAVRNLISIEQQNQSDEKEQLGALLEQLNAIVTSGAFEATGIGVEQCTIPESSESDN